MTVVLIVSTGCMCISHVTQGSIIYTLHSFIGTLRFTAAFEYILERMTMTTTGITEPDTITKSAIGKCSGTSEFPILVCPTTRFK